MRQLDAGHLGFRYPMTDFALRYGRCRRAIGKPKKPANGINP
jgi:hypothetical protein